MASVASSSLSSEVGQNQFLQLMVKQMQHQDPLTPTDNGQMLAQLAQFSTLSGIETLNSNFSDMLKLQEITQGTSLIGKTISYTNDAGTATSGKVSSVGLTNGALALQIDNDSVSLNQITGIAS